MILKASPDSDAASTEQPFWRGMNVGGVMCLMVPVALYCAVFSAYRRIDPYHPDRLFGDVFNSSFALELLLLAVSGILISVYRRAELRDAVLQWSVPPGVLLLLRAVIYRTEPNLLFTLVFLIGTWSLFSALISINQELRGKSKRDRAMYLPAIQAGFVYIGLFLMNMMTCGTAALFVAWIAFFYSRPNDPNKASRARSECG